MSNSFAGGTGMWCPSCKEVTACKAVPAAKVTGDVQDYNQRFYRADHKDIHFFKRGRQCLTCEKSWVTAELTAAHLEELVQLRDALADIKLNAESYLKESSAAEASLNKLQKSLVLLQALKIDKKP